MKIPKIFNEMIIKCDLCNWSVSPEERNPEFYSKLNGWDSRQYNIDNWVVVSGRLLCPSCIWQILAQSNLIIKEQSNDESPDKNQGDQKTEEG